MPTRPFPPAAPQDGGSDSIGAFRTEARPCLALSQAGTSPRGIGQRLRHLDREWPRERGMMAGLLLADALSGRSPASALMRATGWRGAQGILDGRMALKVLRGDFAGFEEGAPAGHILAAVRGRVGGRA